MCRLFLLAFGLAGVPFLVGCGGEPSDAVRLSGEVTFKGQPVPEGMIYFDPKGTGTQGFAKISDGKYDTRSDGRPAPLGAVTVRIEGFTDSEPPTPLFKHQDEMTVSEGDATQNFQVPESASRNVPKGGSPPA